MHNFNNSQQDWQNYTPCFCSKVKLIHINGTNNCLRNSVNPLFDLHGLFITFICSFSLSVFYWRIQYPLFRISTSIYWINFFLSFLLCRSDIWLTSSLIAKKTKIIFHSLKVNAFYVWCQFQIHQYNSTFSKLHVIQK